ncbi:MAG: alpha-D-ribose 1-methylphosphonate 5-triphosphate diphosphatase [Actinomycetota bacterium]
MTTLALTGVRAVVGDRIVDNATVVVAGDRIDSVEAGGAAPPGAIDGRNLLCLPGLVDSHSDGLEKEIAPRRTAHFPLDYALTSFEGRVRAAGVTTVFHGVAYQHKPDMGRTVDVARQMADTIAARNDDPDAPVTHGILYRFEARDGDALDPLLVDLDVDGSSSTAGGLVAAPLISFEDHTPGQGQFRDPAQFAAAIDPTTLAPGVTAEAHVAELMAQAEQVLHHRNTNLAALSPLATQGRVTMLAHDAESPAEVEAASEAGASVAEFPLTLDAAREARARDMTIVMGAPNALRGGSHSGNASARELVAAGLCDVLASDYLPSALLSSAFVMAAEGCCSLARAIALITSGPATMTGVTDRGRLAEGALADLILVDDRRQWPQVVGVHRAADPADRRVLT